MKSIQKFFTFKKIIKILFILLLLITTNTIFSNTYYIDPTSTSIETPNGTIEHPYHTWDNIPWVANSIYLQKRGTLCEVSRVIKPTVANIIIGAYGIGNRPIIKSLVGNRAKGFEIATANFTLQDIELYSTNDIVCAIILGGVGPFLIDNCNFHDCAWGIRAFNLTGNLIISNTEIHHTGDDGIYTENSVDIEIFGCNIHHVNSDLPTRPEAGGDCIQITGQQGYLYIHDNLLDHSAFGKKFCLIIGSALDGHDEPSEALVERNILIGNQDDDSIHYTSGVYLKESISHLTFRYNTVMNAATGIWLNANTTVHNNIIISCWQGIVVNPNKVVDILNNTLVNNKLGIKTNYGSIVTIYNNIFQSGNITEEHYSLNGTIVSDNNCFNRDSINFYGGGIGTLAEVKIKRNRDIHSFIADPMFVDVNNKNFHLQSLSPCIDKGIIIPLIKNDVDGIAIPTYESSDIGAYEFIVINHPPMININYDSNIFAGIVNIIDASKSYDIDNDQITFKWTIPTGISTTSTSLSSIKILADDRNIPIKYSIQLQVSDSVTIVNKNININVLQSKPYATEIPINNVYACSYQIPNYPENVLDNNNNTRWAANGMNQWILFKLKNPSTIDFIKILFYNGSTRISYFNIYASNDSINWDQILVKYQSCGFSNYYNVFMFDNKYSTNFYKYVKFIGNRSNNSTWNSIYEFHVYGNNLNELMVKSSLLETVANQTVILSPNIISNYFNIRLDEFSDFVNIRLYNLNGNLVYKTYLTNLQNAQIFIPMLSKGIYYVVIITNKKTYSTQEIMVR